jgi:hypothetical protein
MRRRIEHEDSEIHGDLALRYSGFHEANQFIVVDLSCAAISIENAGYFIQRAFHAEQTSRESLS